MINISNVVAGSVSGNSCKEKNTTVIGGAVFVILSVLPALPHISARKKKKQFVPGKQL